jgi:hypothetical protein
MKLIMDYNLSLKEMIAAGFYQEIDRDIDSKRFPMELMGEKETEVELVQIPAGYSGGSTQLAYEILMADAIPAGLEHLLAFGAQYPYEQCKYPIAALDSAKSGPDGIEFVPYIGFNLGRRSLKIARVAGEWDAAWRFLVIPVNVMAGRKG